MLCEHGKFTSEVAIRVEEGLTIVGPVTVSELLGQAVQEEYGLSLGSSSMYLFSRTDAASEGTSFTSVIDYKLDESRLHSFLQATSPQSKNPNFPKGHLFPKHAIREDWEMGYEPGDLRDMHERVLGDDWREFERHYRIFNQTLGQDRLDVALGATLKWCEDYEGHAAIRRKYPLETIGLWLVDGARKRSSYNEAFNEFLLTQRLNRKLRSALTSDTLRQHWAIDPKTKEQIAQLLRCFMTSLGPGQERRLISEYETNVGSGKLLLTEDDPEGFVYEDYNGVRVQSLGKGKVDIRIYDIVKAEAVYSNGQLQEESVYSQNYLYPCIRWSVNSSGERTWNFDFLSDGDLATVERTVGINKDMPSDFQLDPRRINPVAGLLAVAYLSPEVRAGWNSTESLTSGGKQQGMGPAQVPVVALMRKAELLDSPFIQVTEDLVSMNKL